MAQGTGSTTTGTCQMKTSYEQFKTDVDNAWREMGPILLISVGLYFWQITLAVLAVVGVCWVIVKIAELRPMSAKRMHNKELERKRKIGYDV